jgi:hypothetical protein
MSIELLPYSMQFGVMHRELQRGDIYVDESGAYMVAKIEASGHIEVVETTPEQVSRRREAIEQRRALNR